ncbi:MAG: hypothetical protein O3A84_06165 [Proteobacteria bacterium]|nr:hypothetical protein [Pseudomonadota bacterium]
MAMRRHLYPDVITDQKVISLPSSATVREAAVLMDEKEISSVLVASPILP